MNTLKESRSFAFSVSILLHCLLLSFLFINFKSEPSLKLSAMAPQEIVQATVVDEKLVAAEITRLENLEQAQQKMEAQKQQVLREKTEQAKLEREQEQMKVLQLKKELQKTREKEEAKLAELRMQQEKEKQALEAIKQAQAKQKQEQALKDAAVKPVPKKVEADAATPAKKTDNPLTATKDKSDKKTDKSSETKAVTKKTDTQKKNNLQASKQSSGKTQSDHLGQAEQALQNALHQDWISSELSKYQSLIQSKVNQAWVRAPGLPSGLLCLLEIRLLPNGTVVELKISSSSGNLAFDQAAEAAIRKASPLPVPTESELMDKFKHFTFEFRPPEGA